MTFQVPQCECGHPIGDHQSNRATFPHKLQYGLCQAPGCNCTYFREVEPKPDSEAAA